jgi:hypothetical protein
MRYRFLVPLGTLATTAAVLLAPALGRAGLAAVGVCLFEAPPRRAILLPTNTLPVQRMTTSRKIPEGTILQRIVSEVLRGAASGGVSESYLPEHFGYNALN